MNSFQSPTKYNNEQEQQQHMNDDQNYQMNNQNITENHDYSYNQHNESHDHEKLPYMNSAQSEGKYHYSNNKNNNNVNNDSPSQQTGNSFPRPSLDTPMIQFTTNNYNNNINNHASTLLFHDSDDGLHSGTNTPILVQSSLHHQNNLRQQHIHHQQNLADKKRTVFNFVKSRGELLEYESEYYDNLRQKVIRKRRTKIIATLNQNNYKCYEQVRDLYLAGVNSFLINMAYCESQFLVQLSQWRDQLEKDYHVHIPLTCVLKGSLVRIGMLSQPETYLRKGQEFRIIIKKKIVGDSNICSVDDDNLIKRIGVGAKIIIDYGQVGLTVIGREKSDATLKYLQDNFNYGKSFTRPMSEKQKITDNYVNSSSASDADNPLNKRMSETSIKGTNTLNIPTGSISKTKRPATAVVNPTTATAAGMNNNSNNQQDASQTSITETKDDIQQNNSSKNVFADQLIELKKKNTKNQNRRQWDVIVCTVDSDCMLKSYKPIFIYKSRDEKETLFYSHKNKPIKPLTKQTHFTEDTDDQNNISNGDNQSESQQLQCDNNDEDDEEVYDTFCENGITVKDLTDISNALNHDIDSICVSNVRTAEEIIAVKRNCQPKTARIIAKIQTLEGVQNFDEILKASDAVLIARGYLTVHIPVEKLHFKQKELIQKSNENLKPVLVSCNILDSMVSSLLPTTCEVGEISNLVSDYVDAIILSGETSYGMYPIQAIETLSRICMETEARQILNTLNDSHKQLQIQWSKQSVINSIVRCTLDAAYNIQANLIIVFTSTGSTAVKISKLRPPCPIIAVTSNSKVARYLSYLSSVTGKEFPSLVGTSILIEKVISYAKEQKYVRPGDYVIITSGEIENLSGTTNNLKILQVE